MCRHSRGSWRSRASSSYTALCRQSRKPDPVEPRVAAVSEQPTRLFYKFGTPFCRPPLNKSQVDEAEPESSLLRIEGIPMTKTSSRRALFARLRGGPLQHRPPWSKSEAEFTDACTQCGKCLDACPVKLLDHGHAGYPIVDFSRGGCTFCGSCADACEAGCFVSRTHAPWPLCATISPACVEPKGVTCRICGEACKASAIRFRPMRGGIATAAVDLVACTGCGACVAPCPVGAIVVSEPVTALETSV